MCPARAVAPPLLRVEPTFAMKKLEPLREILRVRAPRSDQFLVVEHNRVASRGTPRFDEATPGAIIVSWADLFRQYPTDAHVVQYIDQDGSPARLSRQSLTVAAEGYFESLRYPLLAIDLDNPGHTPWPENDLQVESAFHELCARMELLPNPPSAVYLTRGGARLLWALWHPVGFSDAMGLQAALADATTKLGLPLEVDAKCMGQWGRLFRLQRVVRDGEPTWTHAYAQHAFTSGPPLDPATAAKMPVARAPRFSDGKAVEFRGQVEAPLPDAQKARALVYQDGDPDSSRTKLGERIRARLVTQVMRSGDWLDRSGRFRFHTLLNARGALAENRNSTLMEGMSWLSAVLGTTTGCTAEAIYGYIEPMLAATDEETEPPNPASDRGALTWAEYAWGWLYTRWKNDQQSLEMEREEQAKVEQETAQVRAANIGELAEWLLATWPSPPAAMRRDPARWLEGHIIVQASREKRMWVLNTHTGGYVERSTGNIPLATVMQALGWSDFVGLHHDTKDGPIMRRDIDILQCHAAVVESVESEYSENNLSYPIDHPSGSGICFLEPAFYPNPNLRSVYHPAIDAFLDDLVGGRNEGEKLRALLAHLADIKGTKLPMIVLAGFSGTGKSMLLKGIQHLWYRHGRVARQADVMGILGNFNESMAYTPLVTLDETSVANLRRNEIGHIFDRLKSLVSGSEVAVKQRYRDDSAVTRNFRVIICSNDVGIPNTIATSGSRDVDLRSIEAQLLRMEAFRVPQRLAPLMQKHTQGWVDEGHIANHIVWLSQQPRERWERVREKGRAHDDIYRVGAGGIRELRARFQSDCVVGLLLGSDMQEGDSVFWDAEDEVCGVVLRALDLACRQTHADKLAFAAKGAVVLKSAAFDSAVSTLVGLGTSRTFSRNSSTIARYLPLKKNVVRKPLEARVWQALEKSLKPEMEHDDPRKWLSTWRQIANLEGAVRAAEEYGGCNTFVRIGKLAIEGANA